MGDHGLTRGTPAIKSVGAICFGPDDVLFVADSLGAKVFAIDVADPATAGSGSPFELERVDAQLAGYFGCDTEDVVIRDLAVHPRTDNVYLSVTRGRGSDGIPLIVRIDSADGSLSDVALRDVAFAETDIRNAPSEDQEIRGRKARSLTVTDMAYSNGTLLVAGLSNEEFSSNLRRIPFPFDGRMADNSLEIFHVAHGVYETAAPIFTLMPYGKDGVLASYTCTPLVTFSLSDLATGVQAKGRTVAELGAGNQPVDMVTFAQGDREYILVAHSKHPLMKISCADIDDQAPLTEPLERDRVMEMLSAPDITAGLDERFGVPRTALPQQGVTKLARLNGSYVLMMQRDEGGASHLRSYATASL